MKKILILPILLVLSIVFCSCNNGKKNDLYYNWSYRIGDLSDEVQDVAHLNFRPVEGEILNRNLAPLHPEQEGIVWLKKELYVNRSAQDVPVSIHFGSIMIADKTYINGQLVGYGGKFPPYYYNGWNESRNYPIPNIMLNSDGKQTLLIKMYVNAEAGIYGRIVLDERFIVDEIHNNYEFYNVRVNMFLAIMAIVFSWYHLNIYLHRRKEKDGLLFAGVCFVAAMYQTNFFLSTLPWFSGEYFSYLTFQKLIFTLEFFTLYMFNQYLIHFFNYPRKKLSFRLSTIFILGVIIAFFSAPDYHVFLQVRSWMFYLLIAFFLYTNWLIIYSVYKKKKYALITLLVGTIFIICALYDVIYHMVMMRVDGPYLSGIGFIFFIIGNAGIIAQKFVGYQNDLEISRKTMQERVEKRTEKLKKANEQLIAYNNELKETQKRLIESAVTDPLTELYNRQEFQRRITLEVERCKRQYCGNPFSVVFIDLDNFKYYNDNFGHLLGDELLRIFSDIIKAVSRKADCVARYGGDEFIILMPDTDVEKAVNYCERIKTELEKRNFLLSDINEYLGYELDIPEDKKLTCSFGIAQYSDDYASVDEVLHYADIALYQSKSGGKNRYQIFKTGP